MMGSSIAHNPENLALSGKFFPSILKILSQKRKMCYNGLIIVVPL